MHWLKQSTAATIKLGPFVDSADGVTAETGLTIAQADIRLSKNGGNIAQSNNATGATHDELGYYDVPLDATDTNTLGRLDVIVSESGALPVFRSFMVLPANVYDSLFSTDKLQVDAVEISGDSTAADNLEAAADGTGYNLGGGSIVAASVSGAVGSVTGNVGGNVTGSVGSISGVSFPANFPDLSITATTGRVDVASIEGTTATSQLASQAATGASAALATYDPPTKAELDSGLAGLNDPTAAAIADAVWDEVLSGHLTAGTTGNALNAAGSAGDPWTTTLPGSYTGSQAGKILADILVDTGTTIPGTLSGLSTYDGSDTAGTTTLLSRLSSARAGYLDKLNVSGTLAHSDAAATYRADVSGLSTLDAAGVRTAVGLASANLDTQLADLPTVAEFEARTLAAADYATATALATVDTVADGIKAVTDNLPDSGALTTLTANVAAILADTGTDGVVVAAASKSGYALASTGLDAITPAEPSAVPTWGSSSIVAWMGWLGAFHRNKVTQTATTQALRNDADNANVATASVSDDGTTFSRGEFS